ncbi:sulfotransferase family protein [Salinibacter ruber]|uniref:sulfotransferase family protein n=1 Tax=Salinibacter ruber TaxID=146919 RepID=UPI002168F9D3|nr:sulfotransferase [Salinibacter ruber]MCS3824365.1 hypothetical protein [Salinibacter ruber]
MRELERPFLVIGAGSSGTTLLSTILDSHPRLACGPELSFFNKKDVYKDFKSLRKNVAEYMQNGLATNGQAEYRVFMNNLDAYFHTESEVIRKIKNSSSLKDFLNKFFEKYLIKRGKSRWGEKTGSNSYCIENFTKVYPEAKVVHIVRDGRDAVCSLEKRSNSLFHSVSHWVYNVSASIKHRKQDYYLEVKYEDLVTKTEAVLERVFDHIGENFNKRGIKKENSYWYSYSDGNVHSSWGQSPFEEITDESVGRHLEEMSDEVRSLFWSTRLTPHARKLLGVNYHGAEQLMGLLGYEEPLKSSLPPVPFRHLRVGMREYIGRLSRELAEQSRFWQPLTWVPPKYYLFPVKPSVDL